MIHFDATAVITCRNLTLGVNELREAPHGIWSNLLLIGTIGKEQKNFTPQPPKAEKKLPFPTSIANPTKSAHASIAPCKQKPRALKTVPGKMRLLLPPWKTPTISSARIFSSTRSEIKPSACAISSPQLASVSANVSSSPSPEFAVSLCSPRADSLTQDIRILSRHLGLNRLQKPGVLAAGKIARRAPGRQCFRSIGF
jgi:hypothetical protein